MKKYKLIFAVFSVWTAVVIYFQSKCLPVKYSFFFEYLFGSVKNFEPAGALKYFFSSAVEIFLAAFLVVISYIIGRRVAGSLKKELDTPGFFIISSATGFALIAGFIFLLASAGLLYEAVIYSLFIGLCLFALFDLKKEPAGIKFEPGKYTGLEKLAIILLVFSVILNLFCALTPETFYDSLLYHLGLPSIYLNAHSFVKTPYNIFSGFPGNAEMLFTLGLVLNGAITAKLINFIFGLLLLFGVYSFGKKYTGRTAGLLAALIFYTMPMVSANQVNTQVDIILTFYVFSSLYLALHACEKKFSSPALALSGLFAGFAMGIKYSGLIFAAGIFAAVFYMLLSGQGLKNKVKAMAAFLFFALLPVAPWLCKNYIFFSNPFYPYLSANPQLSLLAGEQAGVVLKGITDVIKLPWTLTLSAPFSSMNPGPLLLILAPLFVWLLFYLKKEKLQIRALLIFLVISALLWLPFTRIARFFLPGLLFASVISAYAMLKFLKAAKDDYFDLTINLVIPFIVFNLVIWAAGLNFRNMDPASLASGKLTEREYLSAGRPTYPNPYYPALSFINKQPGTEKVLFVGETRMFYSKKQSISGSVYDKHPLLDFAKRGPAEGGLRQVLQGEGVGWLLLNYGELARCREKYGFFELVNYINSAEFKAAVTPVYRSGSAVVFAVNK